MTKSEDVLVMGIDPGYDRVGVSIIRTCLAGAEKLVHSECIKTSKIDSVDLRIITVCDKLSELIDKYKPVATGLETVFFFKNQKTVMSVSEARGAIKYILNKNKIRIIELTPMEVKSSVCGDGHAGKDQVEYMVRNILKLKKEDKYIDDEVDSMAIALTAEILYKNRDR